MADWPESPRPRIVLITRNLPPLRGGMERLNLHVAQALAEWGDLRVVGPVGCRDVLPAQCRVEQVPTRPLWRFLMRSLGAAWHWSREPADIVLAGSGLTGISALLAARRSRARAVVYVHGLDLLVRHPLYRWLWIPALRRFDLALANSANTADIAARLGVARGRIAVVHPGVSLPDEPLGSADTFRARHGLAQRPVLLSVGRLTARKGLSAFVRQALPVIRTQYPEVVLVVIGDDAQDALSGARGDGRAALQDLANSLGIGDHVRLLGPCDDDALSEAYRGADIHVFPVRDLPGDVEGFGMVAIEAAAHGLPTVAFAVGGVPDAVSHGRSGYLLPPEDYAGFAERTCQMLADGANVAMRASAREFAAGFRWEKFGEHLREELACRGGLPTSNGGARGRGHAVLNLGSRNAKARKIEALLGLAAAAQPVRLLEVGTGSGGIAHHFATHPGRRFEVDAVDVNDSRQIQDGYRFTQVSDIELPFPDGQFDVVISNHVIEHVGDRTAQRGHLAELRRVVKPDGVGYLAVPSRWQLVEPHYRLAFLSWLPVAWRTPYLRWRRRGDDYDCRPLSVRELEPLLAEAGFHFVQQHGRALRATFELERPHAWLYRAFLKHVPEAVYERLRRAFPTLIYILKPVTPARRAGAGDPDEFDRHPWRDETDA